VRARKRVHTWYGCTAHAENGKIVCAQRDTISAHRSTEALVARLRELLANPTTIAAFVRGFERRAAARTSTAKFAGLETRLAKAKKRAGNAAALLVEDPSDADARQMCDEARAEVAASRRSSRTSSRQRLSRAPRRSRAGCGACSTSWPTSPATRRSCGAA